jgi:HEAT repeat protein
LVTSNSAQAESRTTGGFFGWLRGLFFDRKERRIEKSRKTIADPKAIKDDRWAALEFIGELDDPEIAVPTLLKRFEFSLEHGINDAKEKERALAGISKHGEKAIPYVEQHLRETTRIAWPIKALKALGSDKQIIEVLKNAIDFGDVAFDQDKVDKNYDILCYLVDYQLGDFATRLTHFLRDPDERVRFACVETLVEQQSDNFQKDLEPFLIDESAENTRIRQTVLEAFVRHGWIVKNREKIPEGRLTKGYFLDRSGKVLRLNQ